MKKYEVENIKKVEENKNYFYGRSPDTIFLNINFSGFIFTLFIPTIKDIGS